LLPIGAKPALLYVVEEAVAADVRDVVLVCSPQKRHLADLFAPNPELTAQLAAKGKQRAVAELSRIESLATVRVAIQRQPLGLGDAIRCAKALVGNRPFAVALPDVLMQGRQAGLPELVHHPCAGWRLLLEEVTAQQVEAYGVIAGVRQADGTYRIERAIEKPSPDTAPSRLAIAGRYCFPPEIFAILDGATTGALGEIQLTDAINTLAQRQPGFGIVSRGRICDIGTPEGMAKAYRDFV
ncbi:MAG: UTP--glucose-1-phosphate uridylyltransferase, partial [Deltaproteobacteria bacterium]|nr:UTP--glucose-1-phosphate uridylyltransferase [Deltaproteobacteria bacterium]